MNREEKGLRAASELFARFLSQLEAGVEIDFDSFCNEHADEREALRQLHDEWRRIGGALDALGLESVATGDTRVDRADERESWPPPGTEGSAGRYVEREKVGDGGQAEVWSVWDRKMRRALAMKVARTSRNVRSDSTMQARLLEEAQVTGQLDHPGIAPVHDWGLDSSGRLYFTMKLVRGRSLARIIVLAQRGEEGWTRTRLLASLLRVCEAMAYAHSKGVVHRDLKPDNIMVARFGEVYVMDWGLARVLGSADTRDIRIRMADVRRTAKMKSDELRSTRRDLDADSPLRTMDGDIIGTPAYMAPEQARGDLEAIGPASDVYALGAVLYHCVVDHAPYCEEGPIEGRRLLVRLLAGPPPPAADIAPKAPRGLCAICDKAMARDPAERYPDTEALAEDVRAFLEGRVVSAFETGAWPEARQWVRRNRALSTSLVATVLATVFGLVAVLYTERAAASARSEAQLGDIAVANIRLANDVLDAQDVGEARRLLQLVPERLRGWEWSHLALRADTATLQLDGGDGSVMCVAVSPSGNWIASGSASGRVHVWHVQSGEHMWSTTLPDAAPIAALVFTVDERHVVVGHDACVRVLATSDGRVESAVVLSDEVRALDRSGDGSIAIACLDGQLALWSPPWSDEDLRELAAPNSRLDAIHTLVFVDGDPRSSLLTATNREVRLWSTEDASSRRLLGATYSFACSPNGRIVWKGPAAPAAWMSKPDDAVLRQATLGHEDEAVEIGSSESFAEFALEVDDSGSVLARGDRSGRVQTFFRAPPWRTFLGHTAGITDLEFSTDRSFLVSSSLDGTVRVWRPGVRSRRFVVASKWPVIRAQFLGDDRLVVLTGDGRLVILDARTGAQVRDERHSSFLPPYQLLDQYGLPRFETGAAEFSRDGARLAVGDLVGAVTVVDTETGEVLSTTNAHDGAIGAIALDAGSTRLATGGRDGVVKVWSWPGMELLRDVRSGGEPIASLCFSRDRGLVWGTEDGWVEIFDLTANEVTERWSAYSGPVRALEIARNGRIVTTSDSPSLRLWSVEHRASVLTLTARALVSTGPPPSEGHPPRHLAADIPLNSLAFDSREERLVAGTQNGVVVVWETDGDAAPTWGTSWNTSATFLTAPPAFDAESRSREITLRELVDRLFRKHLFVDAVVEALDGELLGDDEIALAQRYAREHGALATEDLADIAWNITRDEDRSSRVRERALNAAFAAWEREPQTPWHRVLLGAAQFRAGELETAELTLRRSVEELGDAPGRDAALAHAFLARVLASAGRPDDADAAGARARAAAIDDETRTLVEALLEVR